ncbi:hypothetical protein FACS1894109_10980 [Spirochaetia bacterium]|nr:hypothetical protein FACS1894109_10980 [Spirochaetia bacterium]
MSAKRKPKPNYIRQTDKSTTYAPWEDKEAYKKQGHKRPKLSWLEKMMTRK